MTDTITLPREVVQLALDAFEAVMPFSTTQRELKIRAVDALRTALAAEQPKPEPVAWQCREHGDDEWFDCSKEAYGINPSRYVYRCLYTAPPATHPGYVIGSHWLETAYSRICAGEAEADVLRDCGWERVDDAEALRRDAEWLTDEQIDSATSKERDDLLDHIYEYGTAAEGILERIRKLARAAIDAAMGDKT